MKNVIEALLVVALLLQGVSLGFLLMSLGFIGPLSYSDAFLLLAVCSAVSNALLVASMVGRGNDE